MLKILFVYVNIYLIGNEIKIGILLLICYLKIKVYKNYVFVYYICFF